MELGIQIYGCMDLFRQDPDGFLQGLSAAGYTQVEPCVAFGISGVEILQSGMNPVWLPEEVRGFAARIREHGLSLRSCHMFGDNAKYGADMIKLCEESEIGQIVLNLPSGLSGESCRTFAAACKAFALRLKQSDIELWLHNGFSEIREQYDGKSVYEYVLESCAGTVGAQADVGWVLYGGREPVSFLQAIRPYLRSLHYKDLKKGYETLERGTIHSALGSGVLNTAEIYRFAAALQVPQLIDQDASDGDFMEDLRQSAAVLAALEI